MSLARTLLVAGALFIKLLRQFFQRMNGLVLRSSGVREPVSLNEVRGAPHFGGRVVLLTLEGGIAKRPRK